MKARLTLLLLLATTMAFAQSTGIRALKDKFKGADDVHHFKLGGSLARMAFKFVDDEEFKEVVREIKSIEFITIPRPHFSTHGVSVKGYQKFLGENNFEELMQVRENNELVTVYLAPESTARDERYLILVEDESEIVVIELKGHLDPSKLSGTKITTTQL